MRAKQCEYRVAPEFKCEGKREIFEKTCLASAIVWHDSYVRKSAGDSTGDQTGRNVVVPYMRLKFRYPCDGTCALFIALTPASHSERVNASPVADELYRLIRLTVSHLGELCSIPSDVVPGFSQVGSVPGKAADQRGFLGDLPFPPPLHSGAAPYSPLKTLVLRAIQISPLRSDRRPRNYNSLKRR
ncbi:hypothetical protein PR048_016727 [Dryococelus australis]|uniref:Uncharacterized protein n=1 Tax=Dryococelus australis TaxID=614101 RepID=A0ABQ9H7H5_9NEOP|nr:hypothetical protein PR048_016727 [Dryococelus australis]